MPRGKLPKNLVKTVCPHSFLVTSAQRMADDDSLFSLAALVIPAQVESLQHNERKLEKKDVANILLPHATLEYFVRSGVQASRALPQGSIASSRRRQDMERPRKVKF